MASRRRGVADGGAPGGWRLDGIDRPWSGQRSLRDQIRAAADIAPGLRGEDDVSPESDEDYAARLRLADVRRALLTLAEDAAVEHLARLYSLVTRSPVVSMLGSPEDDSLGHLDERLHAIGELFAREAPTREAVEFGVILLGSVEGFDDRALLLELGIDRGLTPVVVFALARQHRGEQALFELAKRVDGWAKIRTVERLAETTNAEIQAWLLRDGFRNSEQNEHLAFTCAMAGNLHLALAKTRVDGELLRGAADIFVALANGGPAPDLADYPFRAAAIRAWLRHVAHSELDLYQLSALDALSECPEVPADLLRELDALRATPRVAALIELGLRSLDPELYERADAAAVRRRLDTFTYHEARVRSGAPRLAHAVFRMMQESTTLTLERALDAVAGCVELKTLATGPAACSPASVFPQHLLVEHVVVDLARYPGAGERFVAAALRSPLLRNRLTALSTVEAWPREQRSPRLIAELRAAAAVESVDSLKAAMLAFLAE